MIWHCAIHWNQFSRPSGTQNGLNWFISPVINRWAIIGCPYGTITYSLTLNDNTMQRCA